MMPTSPDDRRWWLSRHPCGVLKATVGLLTIVCNLGHSLKQPETIQSSEKELAPIEPTLTALREHISRASEADSR